MTAQTQHVIFRLGDERYALSIHHIQEIIKYKEICETPNSERAYLRGVMNVRGNIIPVISLSERFQMPQGPETRSTRIIITEIAEEKVGIIVDEIINAEHLDILPLPETAGKRLKDFAGGVSYIGETIVPILRLETVLEMGGK